MIESPSPSPSEISFRPVDLIAPVDLYDTTAPPPLSSPICNNLPRQDARDARTWTIGRRYFLPAGRFSGKSAPWYA